jgi:hypothetical protein
MTSTAMMPHVEAGMVPKAPSAVPAVTAAFVTGTPKIVNVTAPVQMFVSVEPRPSACSEFAEAEFQQPTRHELKYA